MTEAQSHKFAKSTQHSTTQTLTRIHTESMKNIIILLSTFAWSCHAAKVCVNLGEEYGWQTLRVSKDKVKWMTKRGASRGACQPYQITTTLDKDERATKAFCKQFKPRGRRGAYSTIRAPKAATDWLLDHNAKRGKCTRRNTGSSTRMSVSKSPYYCNF